MSPLPTSPPPIRFCADVTCPRPSHHRFCDGCYHNRVNRELAIYKSRLAPIEVDIAEVKAMEQEATSLHSAVLNQLKVAEQEAKDAGDEEGVWMWRRRMGAEEERYAVVKKEVDGYLRDLKADREGLKGELGELGRR